MYGRAGLAVGIGIAAIALPAPASAAEGAFPWTVTSRTLPNGLEVHVIPMPSPGVVAWQTWVAVGSGQEVQAGRTGFAHFFEHLMFFGTEAVPRDERERRLLRMGIEENAWTWLDETVYHAVLPASRLADWSGLESDRFQRLRLTPDDVRREAGAVYGEFRKGRSDPAQQLSEAVSSAAFRVHPYGHDTLGLEADIAAMPGAHADAMSFFSAWYRPENTTVVVAGDVDPAAVFALVTRDWGGWAPSPEPTPTIPIEPEQTEPRAVEVAWPSSTAPRLTLAWKIPAHDPDDPDLAALELAADLLLAPEGPLQQRLVREEGLAFDVYGGRDALAAPGLFRIEVTLVGEQHLGRVEELVRAAISSLPQVDATTLGRTRDRKRYGLITSLDDPASVAATVGEAARVGGDPGAIDTFLQAYAEVDAEDLARVVGAWLVDERSIKGTLRPAPEAP